MLKYAKIDNAETKRCQVGIKDNAAFYQKIGMTLLDVEQSYDGVWYLAGYAPPSAYHKLRNNEWVADTIKKPELINELKSIFNRQTEELIVNTLITYTNDNGTINLVTDKITQQNFMALYLIREQLSYPYLIWEGDENLEISKEDLELICNQLFSTVETIRHNRKLMRDGFAKKTTIELINLLQEFQPIEPLES